MSVILINPFEVAPRDTDQFLTSWEAAADYMRRQPGFIATRLHRAVVPNARFAFINVAEWESPQHFMNAIQTPVFKEMAAASPPNYPALYEIVKTQEASSPTGHPAVYQGGSR